MKLVLDIETQNSFKDVGSRSNLVALKVSVAVAYWYDEDKYYVFTENNMDEFTNLLSKTETIIGFNTIGFDLPVLQPYIKGIELLNKKQVDMMLEVEKILGHKISLDSIARASLGHTKISHGLEAIKMWRQKRMDELIAYCKEDVKLTKEIYELGRDTGKIKFNAGWGNYEIPVSWK